MLFHTHAYHLKKTDQNLNPLKVIGSLLPDLALTKVINWNDLHKEKNILDFFHYVENNAPEYNSLLSGIQAHNTLDYHSHLSYKNSKPGFAYLSIPTEMPSLIEKALNVTPENSKILSHNFIESGVEYYLLQDNSDLPELIKTSTEQIDIENISFLLAKFYKKDNKTALQGLKKLFSFALNYNLKTIDGFVLFWEELSSFYLKTKADPKLTKKAIELSLKITSKTYKEFIEYSILSQNTKIKNAN